jgi:hypothetical protein
VPTVQVKQPSVDVHLPQEINNEVLTKPLKNQVEEAPLANI